MEGRSACVFEDVWMASEECTSEGACIPFVVNISTESGAARGLQVIAGEESEWLVSGVRPFGNEGALFGAAACEVWPKTEEAALFSELVDVASYEISPDFVRRGSSESGEGYCLWLLRAPAGCESLEGGTASASFARCERREFVYSAIPRLRFNEPGETLRCTAGTPPHCDMSSPSP